MTFGTYNKSLASLKYSILIQTKHIYALGSGSSFPQSFKRTMHGCSLLRQCMEHIVLNLRQKTRDLRLKRLEDDDYHKYLSDLHRHIHK